MSSNSILLLTVHTSSNFTAVFIICKGSEDSEIYYMFKENVDRSSITLTNYKGFC